ncbi:hypothetical protein GWI33_022894 [Rhynchophorus ferrugineus]|uniref:Uncharacterized protein n=1 Tax=Rhynchophorus ferrugineus TaxID=354439 RepID=A0A834MKV2_RHYFE|nr:hypothetical protein GWI33_022894 [Rhynchophorus ferrugineus]
MTDQRVPHIVFKIALTIQHRYGIKGSRIVEAYQALDSLQGQYTTVEKKPFEKYKFYSIMITKMSVLFITMIAVSSIEAHPQRGSPSLTLAEAQNILIGNRGSYATPDCVCVVRTRCNSEDVNSDVECHPNYAMICCRRPIF